MNTSECAEQQFALEQNIDPARLKRRYKKEPFHPYSCDLYRIDVGNAYSPGDMINVISKITHLKLEQILRFSNSMMALSNMFALARHHRIFGIILPHHWYLQVGEHQVDGVNIVNLPDGKAYDLQAKDLILSGNFFYKDSLKKIYGSYRHADNIALFRPILNLNIECNPLPADELVIHIRSGDLFSPTELIHPKYGQPPLSFYQKVISLEKPQAIHLVFEDKGNPVIDAISHHAKCHSIPCHEVSGNLSDDVNYLLRAQTLVAGRGTFMSGIVSASIHAKKIYSFESCFSSWGRADIQVVDIRDQKQAYKNEILTNWKNSVPQKQMMLEYPMDHLAVVSQ